MSEFLDSALRPTHHGSCRLARVCLLSLFFLIFAFFQGCATIPYDYPRTISSALYLPQKTDLGLKIQPFVVEHRGASGFYLMPSGVEGFQSRVLLIDAAQKTLDLQYYIFRADLTGKFMLDRILAAAARGVRVRLLLDDWRETATMDWWLTMMEIYPNIEVRVFNPFGGLRSYPLGREFLAIFGPERLRARMHNKAFVVDNSVAIVGGRNISDEYFGASSDVYMRDLDVLAMGPIVQKVSAVFDDYWNCVLAVPLKALVPYRPGAASLEKTRTSLKTERESLKNSNYAVKVRDSDFLERAETGKLPLIWAPAEVLADEPLKVVGPGRPGRPKGMARDVLDFLQSARSEILMISPYLVPGQAGLRWFEKMRRRGVAIKIITNSFASTDSIVAQIGYMRYRKALLRLGAELYELRPTPGRQPAGDEDEDEPPGEEHHLRIGSSSSHGALHAKLLVLDRQAFLVGSFNLDLRSVRFDTQDGIIIHSPELAAQAAALFARDAQPRRSYRVRLTDNHQLVWVTERKGHEVRLYSEPGMSFWRGLLGRFFYALLPEAML
jgi:cardiolipin synthase C